MIRRALLALIVCTVLATASAHIRIETPRQRIAIELAMTGLHISIRTPGRT